MRGSGEAKEEKLGKEFKTEYGKERLMFSGEWVTYCVYPKIFDHDKIISIAKLWLLTHY